MTKSTKFEITNMTLPLPNAACPCGSQQNFDVCCQPLLNGQANATTAEALMRSRYSAFATGNIEYLIETLHSDKRQPQDGELLTQALEHTRWLGLQVRGCEKGLEADERGTVEFVATWSEGGQSGFLHEKSSFVKQNDRWYYVDGTLYDTTGKNIAKPKRNEPCWCGSEKKFKKCHGGN